MDEVDDILINNHVVDDEEDDEEMLSGLENDSKQDLEGNDDGGEDEEDDNDDDEDDDDDEDEREEDDEQEDDDGEDDAARMDKTATPTNGHQHDEQKAAAAAAGDSGDAVTKIGSEDVKLSDVDGGVGSREASSSTHEASANGEVYEYYKHMLHAAQIADSYNIYPTAAIPIQTHVNALAVSRGLKYLFLGGSDGYIRKYDLLNTLEGKLSLTILQKHSLAEAIQNAGILQSYWENEIPQKKSEMKLSANKTDYEPKVSPVHSLEVQSECLFILSGLQNGGITMQGVRYMEGSIAHYFKGRNGHTQIVNILRLNGQEDRFLSGSWDKRLLEWDLQTGDIVNEFKKSRSELSSLEMRPLYSSVDVSGNVNSGKENENADDDMDSLFGDEDEDEKQDADNEPVETGDGSNGEENKEQISEESLNIVYDESVFMTSGLNGSVHIWDRRMTQSPALSLERGAGVPPWCLSACWGVDGDHVYAGRRNACVEQFDLKMPSKPIHNLKLPSISGPVSCVKAMPNNKHLLCASRDNIRLYNVEIAVDASNSTTKSSKVPFLIVPGHHGGIISNLYLDPTSRFIISTSGNRGWQGNSTDTTLIYDIDLE
ncbi:BGN_3a_G0035470.mRNA.1.CDS.1 [Saccharomyces cerevisiae]|nr:BGP_1a_G0035310.mRNA.1.CDS.1 [Saccharomyces cerevisiae]CAI4609042.1 BGN_3a_G0035470.mRNA.1.CDS.1 [Saccharomyces cerevisiae]CAI6650643.1 ASN_HP1_G0035040.mRNA.1.CDS.1 [Saccharomyces cerevisiae]CAI7191812.1 BGP_1a_G0035310.mRNA.1.CDS.1 [Saccharomyces cerevisiae]CAI7225817.1 BGN_3a_G0035470.mRNA.1.CDS.1 [Saccharomyces cerevisiae]